ncbi:MAG: hypothetical protein ACOVNL_10000, partial [Prochlorococcaceae cyanobacterium]
GLILAAGSAPAQEAASPAPALPPAPVPAAAAPATPTAPTPARTPTTGQVTIESDLQQADNRTGVITATGNVRIVYPDERVVATARQAQYFSKEGLVILSGDVDVIQDDGHSLRAERVYYWVETERVKAEPVGGEQVFSKLRVDALQKETTPAAPTTAGQAGPSAAPAAGSTGPTAPTAPRTRPAPAPQP